MARYHMNPETGRVNICRSEHGRCPFGSEAHGNTKEEVRDNYEQSMKDQELAAVRKTREAEQAARVKTPGERAMLPWLDYLKEKIDHARTGVSQKELMRGDYSRAVAFSRGKHSAPEGTPKEESLNSYIDYLSEKLHNNRGRSYKEAQAVQAEYARIIAFARGRKLTTR